MKFQVFLSGLMCAILGSNEAASAVSLDQRGADLALDAESYFAQIPNPFATQEAKPEKEKKGVEEEKQ